MRESAMVSYHGGSASNIETLPRDGSPAPVPCQCARASHGAIPRGLCKQRWGASQEWKLSFYAMPMCASQPWCHTKGALRATLRHFLEMEVELLCHANVREPAMVPYQGGSASNIEALPRNGSRALMLCQCARASHGAIPRGALRATLGCFSVN